MSRSKRSMTEPERLFLEEAERLARDSGLFERVERSPDGFALRLGNGDWHATFYLANTFAETREQGPEERAERLRFLLGHFTARQDPPATWEQVAPRLRPTLRPVTYLAASGTQRQLARAFAPHLVDAPAIDGEGTIAYIFEQQLETWGVSAERVHTSAIANLAEALADDEIDSYDPEAGFPIFHVASNDSYESSRLLLPGWLGAFRGRVEGRPVAAVPDRGLLVVSGDGDLEAIVRLAELAEAEFGASARGISPALYTVDAEDRVVPLELPADHPLHARIRRGHLLLASVEYAAQKEDLDAHHEEAGIDVFVASYTAVEPEDRTPVSYAVWPEGVEALLPEVDHVCLMGGDDEDPEAGSAWSFFVPWAVVEAVAGRCWRDEPDLVPARMRTVAWPDAATLEALRAHAVEL